MQNYFSLFELPATFDLNAAELEKRYFDAQRRFHPDRLTGKSPAERKDAIARSMLINEAYEALKTPLKRAQHLLSLNGIAYEDAKPPQALLLEIMELREALASAGTPEDVDRLCAENETMQEGTIKALLQAFANSDIAEATQLTMRLSYSVKLENEIRLRRKTVA